MESCKKSIYMLFTVMANARKISTILFFFYFLNGCFAEGWDLKYCDLHKFNEKVFLESNGIILKLKIDNASSGPLKKLNLFIYSYLLFSYIYTDAQTS